MIARVVVLCAVLLAVAASVPSAASAAWSRARLMSANGVEQALPYGPLEGTTFMGSPDVSADGRFVTFDTAARNLLVGADAPLQPTSPGGIFRRQVDTGSLELVAPAAPQPPRVLSGTAVSADGRFVAFDTTLALVPGDTDTRPDVYVRDMETARTDPSAFTLVSTEPGDAAHRIPGEAALSATGRRVLYYVAESDGTGPARVADLDRGTVAELTPEAVLATPPVLALSADGSTAAWVDAIPRDRVAPGAYLPGEFPLAGIPGDDTTGVHDLLWRRVNDTGPARRVGGAGDADDPACPAGTPLAPDGVLEFTGPRSPCDGVFSSALPPGATRSGATFASASLSGDGARVAFVTSLPRRTGGQQADAFIRDMAAPGGAKATTRELTRFAVTRSSDGFDIRGGTNSVSLADDGGTVAVTTTFERSGLGRPTLVSPTVAPGVRNVYVIDLAAETIERVTRAYDGAEADRGSDRPILSADGRRLTFVSEATNLLLGDGNLRPDVFVADRVAAEAPPLDELAPPVSGAAATARSAEIRPAWRMSVTIGRGGTVLYVDVRVPGAGRVDATARTTSASRRVVGRRAARASRAGELRLRVALASRYRRAARKSAGLPVRVTVRFAPAPRGSAITRTLSSRYRVTTRRPSR